MLNVFFTAALHMKEPEEDEIFLRKYAKKLRAVLDGTLWRE